MKITIGLSLSQELIKEIDSKRKMVSRSAWIENELKRSGAHCPAKGCKHFNKECSSSNAAESPANEKV
jgi:hypothetical protein